MRRLFTALAAMLLLAGMDTAQAGRLGVSLQDGFESGQPGPVVMAVAPDGAASRADIRPGDVILGVQGRFLVAAQQVVDAMQRLPAGTPVQLEVLRFGQRMPMTVVLGPDTGQPPSGGWGSTGATTPAHDQGTPGGRTSPGRPTAAGGGIPLHLQRTQYCSALTPAGWSLQSNPQASTLEALSPDRSLYAGWGVVSIDRSMEPFYGPMYGDPDASIQFLVNQILGSLGDGGGMRYTGGPEPFLNNYFTLRRFESAARAGLVFYRIYPGFSYPQSYVESFYVAVANRSSGSGLPVAGGVAVSIRCQTQLIPPSHEPGGKGRGTPGCGYGGELRGYNKELGSQYAHSPSTGENFLLDAATQWNENGPDGPGYYRPVGNSHEKLELGRDDDC